MLSILSMFAVHLSSNKMQQATVERLLKANNGFVNKSHCNTGLQTAKKLVHVREDVKRHHKFSTVKQRKRTVNATEKKRKCDNSDGRDGSEGDNDDDEYFEFEEEVVLDAGQVQHFQTESWQFFHQPAENGAGDEDDIVMEEGRKVSLPSSLTPSMKSQMYLAESLELREAAVSTCR